MSDDNRDEANVVPLGWRTFANGDRFFDVNGVRYTVRPSPHGYLLRSNGALIATFDTVEAACAGAAVRAEHLRAAQAEEEAWYSRSFPPKIEAGSA